MLNGNSHKANAKSNEKYFLIFTVTITNFCSHSLFICLFIISERASSSYGLLWFL